MQRLYRYSGRAMNKQQTVHELTEIDTEKN
jgi:hypothetical protein